jgi:hypothetical protein
MEFHFVFTVTWQIAKGVESNTFEGTITSRAGQTRQDLYNAVRQHAISKIGTSQIYVTFFDLAPNKLPALASSVCG